MVSRVPRTDCHDEAHTLQLDEMTSPCGMEGCTDCVEVRMPAHRVRGERVAVDEPPAPALQLEAEHTRRAARVPGTAAVAHANEDAEEGNSGPAHLAPPVRVR